MAIIESIPVCGVDIRNAVVAPFEAPSLRNDIAVGITPQEQSGRGIPSDEIDKIFERFYKIDKSRSLDIKGAGMGLYIVKTIIELHGGHITARSEEGNYTEFIFQLPLE